MGMTIDEAIEVLEYLKTQNSQLKSIDFAISIMRKYQMIEQIIEDWTKTEVLEWKIREVLEDGNNAR